MYLGRPVNLLDIADAGDTPPLADRNQVAHVRQWLDGDLADGAHPSVLHAAPRDPYPGKPIPFPPASAQL